MKEPNLTEVGIRADVFGSGQMYLVFGQMYLVFGIVYLVFACPGVPRGATHNEGAQHAEPMETEDISKEVTDVLNSSAKCMPTLRSVCHLMKKEQYEKSPCTLR